MNKCETCGVKVKRGLWTSRFCDQHLLPYNVAPYMPYSKQREAEYAVIAAAKDHYEWKCAKNDYEKRANNRTGCEDGNEDDWTQELHHAVAALAKAEKS